MAFLQVKEEEKSSSTVVNVGIKEKKLCLYGTDFLATFYAAVKISFFTKYKVLRSNIWQKRF